ncbi:methyltransferase [Pycnococcus provasolii]
MAPMSRLSSYASVAYWDARYQQCALGARDEDGDHDPRRELTFDWLAMADDVLPYMQTTPADLADGNGRILEVGCGNSTLAQTLSDAGFRDILAVDFSETVVQMMDESKPPGSTVRYAVADCRDMRGVVGDDSCAAVVDKGLLDAVLNDFDQAVWWEKSASRRITRDNPEGRRDRGCPYDGETSRAEALKVVAEFARVLHDGAELLVVSYEPPSGRTWLFEEDGKVWQQTFEPEEDDAGNFVYRYRRKARTAVPTGLYEMD